MTGCDLNGFMMQLDLNVNTGLNAFERSNVANKQMEASTALCEQDMFA
jgi:hypothetical protein